MRCLANPQAKPSSVLAVCSVLMALLSVLWVRPLPAHEIRAAYLVIHESSSGHVDILWRHPLDVTAQTVPRPSLSSGWLATDPLSRELTDQMLTLRWQVLPPHAPLAGQQLQLTQLKDQPVDVLVDVRYADGRRESAVLSASTPYFIVGEGRAQAALSGYFLLGVEHILTGYDHLLYLLGLVLLVRGLRHLLFTITAFTAAHSITLACAAMGLVHLNPAPIEVLIALSILYVAVEVRRGQQGHTGLGHRWPWLVGFGFGLLHGFGFAGALSRVGLPADAVAASLLKFNLGVEAGQVLFVGAVAGLLTLLAHRLPRVYGPAIASLPTLIGALATYWVLERLAASV